ncbi:hypothetical protein SEA_TEACUP_74 [Arthrobacter phage Teacup]|uniref:Uncharacterized protein n=1 Tax=Arthrobacter phage Teacup TaxID=2015871 RepID=A0A222ZH98_9CAUD|nr:hypothetical protein QCN31_gp74 [Arthrobacter phage Teacup]ASR84086.1 hypothetical protein SEA_TEACUP_74 [Arthrobacter phage Teacup]
MVNEKREELISALLNEGLDDRLTPEHQRAFAESLVDGVIIKLGWSPAYPDPTPEQHEKQKIELEIESVKGLREDLCVVQSALNMYPSGDQKSRVRRIGEIINQLDVMRPLGSNGKHGNLHTDKCGCDFPDPTPEQEIEFLDRLVGGLPARHVAFRPEQWPDDVKLYDVASLYPTEYALRVPEEPTEFFSDWYQIPNYSTYEMNSGGQVRNRSSQVILDYESLPGKWIRLRSDEGEYKIVSVDELLNEVFGG